MLTESAILKSALLRSLSLCSVQVLVAALMFASDQDVGILLPLLWFAIPLSLAISLWRAFAFSHSADDIYAGGLVFVILMSLLFVPFGAMFLSRVSGSERFGFLAAGIADSAIIVFLTDRTTKSPPATRTAAVALACGAIASVFVQALLFRNSSRSEVEYFGASAACAAVGISIAIWHWAVQARLRANANKWAVLCRSCGYDLIGNTSGICPECGTPKSQRPDDR